MDVLISIAGLIDRLDPGVAAFFESFRDGRMPLRLSAAIAASALMLLSMLAIWGAVACGRIYRLRRLVRSCRTVAEFARDFRRIDAALSVSIVGTAWREYRGCLKPSADRVLYPRRPQEYFGLSAIAAPDFPARFFAAAHGYFVGVGLLLTFVGLVAALKFAAGGVASPDIAVAKQALNALLSAASFKFMTSIAGLGCSLLLSVATRTSICGIDGAAVGLAADVERLMVPLVAESLAFDQLAATRAQSVQLEKVALSLSALAIAGAPNAGADPDRTETVLAGFLADLRASAATEIKQVAATLSQVGSAIGQTQSHIGQSGEAFAQQLGLAASQLLDAAAAMQRGIDGQAARLGGQIAALTDLLVRGEAGFARGAAEAGDRLIAASEAAAQRLAHVFGGLDEIGAALAPQIAGMRGITASLADARQALDDSAGTWVRAAAPVAASVEASRQIAGELAEAAGRISTAQHDMARMAGAMARLSESTSSVWDNYRGRFEKVDGDLQAVFEQLQGGTRAFGKEVMEFVGKLDANLADSMQALSIGTEELREVAELLVTGAQAKAA